MGDVSGSVIGSEGDVFPVLFVDFGGVYLIGDLRGGKFVWECERYGVDRK